MAISESIERPVHYTFSAIEPIEVIEAWELGYHLGNLVKYVARAGRKGDRLQDLPKAAWYLRREIERLERDPKGADVESTEEDDCSLICPSCSGTGTSRFSNRPDDYGPHFICDSCRGTGIARQD